ncbi:hypothetical protein [Methylocaldum sp.]|uniref:hypothetical protein n=1 Tax=Methylocaldum sp. TaxID=1969727 RepID=UPI002D4767FB|nr:hypothetical protein [Methylocaldum sp.]HYE34048.1 hypothetical protein [Methylocaldum sp.]
MSHVQTALRALVEGRDTFAKPQADAVAYQPFGGVTGHFRIERRQHLIGHFQTDESPTHD